MKPTWQERLNYMSEEDVQEALRQREAYIKAKETPIIKISDVKYKCTEWKDNIYLESIQSGQDDWVQVEDLTELKVCEYNMLVNELHTQYPDYPIEHLEGRFV